MDASRIDKQMIVDTLRRMGIARGDAVGLHSSVPSLGRIMVRIQKAGGRAAIAQAVHDVIDAFLDAAGGSDGLLMAPTFTYTYARPGTTEIYRPDKTPSKVGLLSDMLFRRPAAHRSAHPTHSVAALGSRADAMLQDHLHRTGLGADSPFHRLAQQGGWICYLGTDSETCSLLHVAEVLAGVPYKDTWCYDYLGWRNAALVQRADGSVEEISLAESPGCSEGFGRFDQLLREAGITRRARIYSSDVLLFRAHDALQLAVEKLKQDPFWLLCPAERCPACGLRRERHRA